MATSQSVSPSSLGVGGAGGADRSHNPWLRGSPLIAPAAPRSMREFENPLHRGAIQFDEIADAARVAIGAFRRHLVDTIILDPEAGHGRAKPERTEEGLHPGDALRDHRLAIEDVEFDI